MKSGGHSQHAGASTADGGVTIDLAKMNKVEVSPDRKSVYVGAGAQWVDVYRTVEAEDLLVVGGRVADVGVGGLLTGGKQRVLFRMNDTNSAPQEASASCLANMAGVAIISYPSRSSYQTE